MTTTFLSLSLSLSFNDRHLSSSPQDLDNPRIVYNQRSFFESVSTNLVPDEIILGNNVQFVFRCTRLGTHQSFQSDETKRWQMAREREREQWKARVTATLGFPFRKGRITAH